MLVYDNMHKFVSFCVYNMRVYISYANYVTVLFWVKINAFFLSKNGRDIDKELIAFCFIIRASLNPLSAISKLWQFCSSHVATVHYINEYLATDRGGYFNE